jgi:proteic killer suppression protein
MIRSFRHKGLKRLFMEDDPRGVTAQQAPKLRRILAQLQVSEVPGDMDGVPGWRLHPLKGNRAGQWSVTVSGNLRIVFRFEGENAVDVDLIDYH